MEYILVFHLFQREAGGLSLAGESIRKLHPHVGQTIIMTAGIKILLA